MPKNTNERAQLTRQSILNCAEGLFATGGYRGTNLGQVADRLGVTRQALYYHFRKKQDVLIAMFERAMLLLEERADEVQATNSRELYSAMLHGHAVTVANNVTLVTVLLSEVTELRAPVYPPAASRRRKYSDRFVRAYELGVNSGELRDLPPRVVVNATIGTMNSLTRWYDPGGKLDPETIAVTLTGVTMGGLTLRSAGLDS